MTAENMNRGKAEVLHNLRRTWFIGQNECLTVPSNVQPVCMTCTITLSYTIVLLTLCQINVFTPVPDNTASQVILCI